MMLPVLLFDYGGVILDHITTRALPFDRLSEFLGISTEEAEDYCNNSIFPNYFAGILSYNQVWDKICKDYKVLKPGNHEHIIIYCMERATLHTDVVEYIKQLQREGYECHYLSDVTKERRKYFLDKGRYAPLGDSYFSCDLGCSKSTANRDSNYKIYEIVLKKLGLQPGQCVFIDDSQTNLNRAEKIGLRTILATNTSQTINNIKFYLLENPSV